MNKNEFLARIVPAAIAEMKESGILASLTIAQAILESGWARSSLAFDHCNLFGVKASSKDVKAGRAVLMPTKEYRKGIGMVTEHHHFRKYNNWYESIKDHSRVLLTTRKGLFKRYRKVIGETDYEIACREIHKAGYATDPDYAALLIDIILAEKLWMIDEEVLKVNSTPAWKNAIMKKAEEKGLIEKGLHDPDESAQKWFVCAVALNTLKATEKAGEKQ